MNPIAQMFAPDLSWLLVALIGLGSLIVLGFVAMLFIRAVIIRWNMRHDD